MKTAVQDVQDGAIPTGVVLPLALASVPQGWQLCDGSVAQSAALLAALDRDGRPHGGSVGAGLVPDMRGRVAAGVGTATGGGVTGATAHTLGQVAGEETHTLAATESGVPAHNHPPLTHGGTQFFLVNTATGGLAVAGAGGSNFQNDTTTGNNTAAAASAAHQNMQPYVGLNHIIKL